MLSGSPNIQIPAHVAHMVRIFENHQPPQGNPVPVYWDSFFVYFKATRKYYAGVTKNFKEYLSGILNKNSAKHKSLPKALLYQLQNSDDIEFIVTSRNMRTDVEKAFSQIGIQRVSTKMGEGEFTRKMMFKVYSPLYKVTRYIVTDANADKEDIIKSVNKAFKHWLDSGSSQYHHLRITLRTATNSLKEINARVFKDTDIVEPVRSMVDVAPNKHRTMVIDYNIQAAKDFLLSTTGVR